MIKMFLSGELSKNYVYESDRDWIGVLLLISWNEVTSPSLCFTWVLQEKKLWQLFIKKTRFQPNEKIFAESCSVQHRDFFWQKKLGDCRHFKTDVIICMKGCVNIHLANEDPPKWGHNKWPWFLYTHILIISRTSCNCA